MNAFEIKEGGFGLPAKGNLDDVYYALIEAHGDRLYKLCLKLTYSKTDADDLFSETILKIFEQPEKLKREHPERLLFTTASYLFKSLQRKYARRLRLVPLVPLDGHDARDATSIQDEVVKRDVHQQLNGFVDKLPDKFKLPLIFYYTLEMSVHEIAVLLKVPEGTVMSRLKRGRERLKKKLMEAGYNE